MQESANRLYRNIVKDLLLPNTVDQKDEKPYTAGLDTVTDVPLGKLLELDIYPAGTSR